IKALILNSPFLEWNLPPAIRRIAMPIVSALGRIMPAVRLRQRPDTRYAETLSAEHGGEWNYRKYWKPDILPDPDMGWARAIHTGQRKLRKSTISVPVLLMRSADSVRRGDNKEKYYHADAILDVETISRYGKNLGNDVTEISLAGGLHDLALSKKEVRQKMYETMLGWLKERNM
nr:alpha/beta hydrolase [Rikenellaceae bacterium]